MNAANLKETIFSVNVRSLPPGKLEATTLRPEMNLRRDLGLDSLGMVSLLTRCGEELGIEPDDLIESIAAERINTVGDVVAMGAKLAKGAIE